MPTYDRTTAFYMQDLPRTLFPMSTNHVLIESCAGNLADYIYKRITSGSDSEDKFLPQERVYAAKPRFHLRRTVKLDPIAEFFFYDLVYRNRSVFRPSVSDKRTNYGYRFKKGGAISPATSYRAFKTAVHEALETFEYCVKCDISSYFNSIYHHDLVNWFSKTDASDEDTRFFDKFLKQTNAGRSIDCLPHGIYPAKMIGSHFLRFVDESTLIRSPLLLRFMDDIYLFSDQESDVVSDFVQIQRLLGDRGLSVNPVKTKIGNIDHIDIEREIDAIKLGLLTRRSRLIIGSGDEEEEFEDEDETLTEEEEAIFSICSEAMT